MNSEKYKIMDECRENLLKYTFKAFSLIPKPDNPIILDIGCGTGVPTLALAENFNGIIYAVDSDKSSLTWLQKKIDESKYSDRIKIIHASINENYLFNINFDIILAEGFLNVIGFEKGLPVLVKHIKSKGYIIIHDEIKDDARKKDIFKKYNLNLIGSFRLDKNEWWDDYYRCMEAGIKSLNDDSLFKNEISEIKEYKKNPESFKSIYYILQFAG
ncbi:MAG: class I SAM-dependent methyltransferase [Spirochaetota bacterium]